jgi:hypothetical protein
MSLRRSLVVLVEVIGDAGKEIGEAGRPQKVGLEIS